MGKSAAREHRKPRGLYLLNALSDEISQTPRTPVVGSMPIRLELIADCGRITLALYRRRAFREKSPREHGAPARVR